MDEATLARATEPFFTTKGAGKGTGLGLSMVHGLAAQSGGALRLSSRPGAGTTAELWLPRAPALPARATAAPPQSGAADPAFLYRPSGRRRRADQHGDLRDAEGSRPSGGRGALGQQSAGHPARGHVGRPGGIRRGDAEHEGHAAGRRDPRLVARSADHPRHRLCRAAEGQRAASCRCCASPIRSRISPRRSTGRSVPRPRRRLEREGGVSSARRWTPTRGRAETSDPC